MTDLSVGVLTADLLRLGEELEEIARTGVTRLHVDVNVENAHASITSRMQTADEGQAP